MHITLEVEGEPLVAIEYRENLQANLLTGNSKGWLGEKVHVIIAPSGQGVAVDHVADLDGELEELEALHPFEEIVSEKLGKNAQRAANLPCCAAAGQDLAGPCPCAVYYVFWPF